MFVAAAHLGWILSLPPPPLHWMASPLSHPVYKLGVEEEEEEEEEEEG